MSEVVPLPSFGEVFFDARGQDRVLRVTWHEGTLVLSLWRGEMCTASFRMPMAEVDRLIDTLDEGLAEVGGHDGEGVDDPATGPFPGPQIPDAQIPDAQISGPQIPDGPAPAGPEGYAPPHEGFQDQGYRDQGYQDQVAYQDQGYQDQDFREHGTYQDQTAAYQDQTAYQSQAAYQEQGYREQAGYRDQGYQDQGYQEQVAYRDQGYQEQGYQDNTPYQQDQAPYQDYPDYPGTGQYARPPIPPPVSNDVLVARGASAPDRLVAAPSPEPDVDPDDPLGLGVARPYVPDPMYATGERLRPDEQQLGQRHEDDWGR
ncbi:hypothetical protein ACFHYQ_14255 [Sphaerimonospora cavernae]|uniref:Uncharacterized protein n=1 Tax=Sphaerimonospora cavernae TaxID=1740611 RepID=A0ABV6U610_9ACTN